MFKPYPPAIVFVNNDLTDQVKSVLKTQLFIDQEMTGAQFDGYMQSDPAFANNLRQAGKRVLVIQDFWAPRSNHVHADVAIFIKYGLAYIEKNNFGPKELALPVTNLYIYQLLRYNNLIV